MSDKEVWIPDASGKNMIPVNRAARKAFQKLKGGALPPPIKLPKVNN